MKMYKKLAQEDKVLSCDHTFKVAKNVKIVADGKKVVVWSCLYTVFWKGQLLIAQFLLDGTLEKLRDIFQFIQDKLGGIHMLLSDDCCKNSPLNEICPGMKNRKDLAHSHGFNLENSTWPPKLRRYAVSSDLLEQI